MNKLQYVKLTVEGLDKDTPADMWAKTYVASRIEFFYYYNPNKLIVSTLHGANFFHNMLAVMEGRMIWKETDDQGRETEYSRNFNKLCHES